MILDWSGGEVEEKMSFTDGYISEEELSPTVWIKKLEYSVYRIRIAPFHLLVESPLDVGKPVALHDA